MKRIRLAAAALLGLAGAASAQGVAEQVTRQLRAQGFTEIEVDQGPIQVRVEALRGRQQVEYVYSLATGELLGREVRLMDGDANRTPRLDFGPSGDDVVDARGRGGDDRGDGERGGRADRDRGHGNDEDGFDEDNPGRGHDGGRGGRGGGQGGGQGDDGGGRGRGHR